MKPLNRIAIIVAMSDEEQLMKNVLSDKKEETLNSTKYTVGTVGNHQVALLRCGIGKVNAAVMTTELIAHFKPDFIINSGVAGGLGKDVRVGDVVVGTECCYHDMWCGSGEWGQVQGFPPRFQVPAELVENIKKLNLENTHYGLICTGDQFICNLQMVLDIKKNFPEGIAVDMESCAIAHVSYIYQIPYLSIRVISDTPGMEHDNTSQYFDFWTKAPQTTFETVKRIVANL